MKPGLRWIAASFALLAAMVAVGAAAASPPGSLTTASQRIEQAWYRGNAAQLGRIAATLPSASEVGATRAKYADYYIGLADYLRARLLFDVDERAAGRCLDAAEDALQRALRADGDFAEAHALLASSLGLEIAMHPLRGMWLGRRASGHLERAKALAPGNPRVVLAAAISDDHKPASFGGDRQRALAEYGDAIAAFGTFTPSDPLAPTWGEAEAYLLRAHAEVAAGLGVAARRDYAAALKLVPDYADARSGLAKLGTASGPGH